MSVTTDELLDALASAQRSDAPEDARTAQEMAADTGLVLSQVQKALRALHRVGRLDSCRVQRVGIDGRQVRVPAYTIRPAP